MAKEIERKFLVINDSFLEMATGRKEMVQGYLSSGIEATTRVRIADQTGFLTVKSKTKGLVRDEWEYEIPKDDALSMLKLCGGRVVEKTRYIVPFEGYTWEVDVFYGRHKGLFLAEVEMPSADCQPQLPPFVGEEVTGNPAYYNSRLASC